VTPVVLFDLDGTLADSLPGIAAAPLHDTFAALMVDGTVVFEGVVPALEQLSEEGVLMAVATSKAQPLAVELLRGLGLASFFAAVRGPVPPARDARSA
jgi:phosphoglycolate phosphatase-like HAD superfamily hydrolase